MGKTYRKMKKDKVSEAVDPNREPLSLLVVGKLILGFVLLYAGGELLVKSGSELGRLLGVKEYVISAIFAAFGTSLPELITALIACWKKKDADLITGNIVGSNIFNVAFVLASLGGYQISFDRTFSFEIAVLLGASLFLLILSAMRKNFFRISGGFFLIVYAGVIWKLMV